MFDDMQNLMCVFRHLSKILGVLKINPKLREKKKQKIKTNRQTKQNTPPPHQATTTITPSQLAWRSRRPQSSSSPSSAPFLNRDTTRTSTSVVAAHYRAAAQNPTLYILHCMQLRRKKGKKEKQKWEDAAELAWWF